MNSEQIQDFLTNLAEAYSKPEKNSPKSDDEAVTIRKFLAKNSQSTLLCMQYVAANYTNLDFTEPIIEQLLALYFKGGLLRQYALQFIPSFVGVYLIAVSKRQRRSVSILENFFLALYNEESLSPADPQRIAKRIDKVRIPCMSVPSVYHDPIKLNTAPEVYHLKPDEDISVDSVVENGPFPTIERFLAEQKFFILCRLLSVVNSSVCIMTEPVGRAVCLATLSICRSGYAFRDTDLRSQVLGNEISKELLDDYSKKPRQHVCSELLRELLYGCYYAVYNGVPDLALRAIDAIHLRAEYEIFSDVLLISNAIRDSLLDNPLSKDRKDELMFRFDITKDKITKDCVTNASLRLRRMPEDIPIQEEPGPKGKSEKLREELADGVDHLRKKMSQISHGLKHKRDKHKKHHNHHHLNGENGEEYELKTIEEDRSLQSSFVERPEKLDGEDVDVDPTPYLYNENEKEAAGLSDSSSSDEDADGGTKPFQDASPNAESKAFSVRGFRHMDSGSGTERSVDF